MAAVDVFRAGRQPPRDTPPLTAPAAVRLPMQCRHDGQSPPSTCLGDHLGCFSLSVLFFFLILKFYFRPPLPLLSFFYFLSFFLVSFLSLFFVPSRRCSVVTPWGTPPPPCARGAAGVPPLGATAPRTE